MIKNKWFLIALIFPILISSFYILFSPGKIKSDAAEYDGLANSILEGKYELNGKPSMEREPGYPFFRAILKTLSKNEKFILFVQLILYLLTIIIIAKTFEKVDKNLILWALFGASLSYALAFYPSTHLSETFSAFLLSIFGYLLITAIDNPIKKYRIYLSIISSAIVLTRYPYMLIPIVFIIILSTSSLKKNFPKKIILKNILISISILTILVMPWIIRNYVKFQQIQMAGRSGAGLYARAWKAEHSWRSLGDSYLSSILGRGILYTVYPNNQSIWLDQWGDWWRDEKTIKTIWGDNPVTIDQNRKEKAMSIIFSNFNTFSKFVIWSGVDDIRFLQLQNPIPEAQGSPFEGTYGPLAKEKGLNKLQLTGLLIANLIQLIWLILIPISMYIGFKKYGIRFVPGILLIPILLIHSLADNIPRYGAPLQPWLLSAIFITILPPLLIKVKSIYEKRISNISNTGL